MNLIEEIHIDGVKFKFFDGIEFNIISNHCLNGSDGFIFCFIDNWESEVKKWERDSKINSVIKNDEFTKFESSQIENDYVAIYQLNGVSVDVLFKVIKDKVLNKNFPEHPWIPISGVEKGAWRIGKSRYLN